MRTIQAKQEGHLLRNFKENLSAIDLFLKDAGRVRVKLTMERKLQTWEWLC